MALLGLGLVPDMRTVLGETFRQHTALADHAVIDPRRRLRTLCHAVPGVWLLEGIGSYSGMSMRWFRDASGAGEGYGILEDLARDVPAGAAGVVALLSNVMQADRWMHCSPTFMGFDLDRPAATGRGACVRAIEEAAAYVAKAHFVIIDEVVGEHPGELAFAGGAAGGTLWPISSLK